MLSTQLAKNCWADTEKLLSSKKFILKRIWTKREVVLRCVCVCVFDVILILLHLHSLDSLCEWLLILLCDPSYICQEDCQQVLIIRPTVLMMAAVPPSSFPHHPTGCPPLPTTYTHCLHSPQECFLLHYRPSRTIAAATERCRKATPEETGWGQTSLHRTPSACQKYLPLNSGENGWKEIPLSGCINNMTICSKL